MPAGPVDKYNLARHFLDIKANCSVLLCMVAAACILQTTTEVKSQFLHVSVGRMQIYYANEVNFLLANMRVVSNVLL